MATTRIDITAKDSTAAAFASAQGNLSSLSTSAVQAAASIAGVTLSFAGLAASIKSSIDAADETGKMAQKIGVAVEEIAGLELAFKQSGLEAEKLQSSLTKLGKSVADGNSAFDAMGISTKNADGNLKTTREILGEVADKFAGYQDGIAKTALAVQIFGKAGNDLIPLLNGGSKALAEFDALAQKLGLTLSKDVTKRAEEFNDTMSLVGASFKGLSTKIAAEMLPTLQGLAEQLFKTASEGRAIKEMADVASTALKGLVATGIGVAGAFRAVGTAIGGFAAAAGALAGGQFAQAAKFAKEAKDDFAGNLVSTIDAATAAWNANGSATVAAAAGAVEAAKKQAPLTSELTKSTAALENKNKAQSEALRMESEYIKLLEIERKQHADLVKPFQDSAKSALEQLEGIEHQIDALKVAKDNQIDLQKAVQLTTIARLEESKAAVQDPAILAQIESEIAARKEMLDLLPQQKALEQSTADTTDKVSELWKQAGRNIQSTLASSIFDFFDDGLDGMVKNVATAVGRIASEFAALKIAEGAGVTSFFGAAGGKGGTSGVGGQSIGASALGLAQTGFGATNLIAGVGGALPGSSGAFFSGFGGGTAVGVSSPAALMGARVASFAGPAIAIAAVDQITRMLVGSDKKLTGAAGKALNFVPILGPLINGLFGSGPLKQGMTTLKGNVGTSGFTSGALATRFDSKGGAFGGGGTDFAAVDAVSGKLTTDNKKLNKYAKDLATASAEIIGVIEDTTSEVSKSLYKIADDMDLSTSGLDNFSHQIKLVSEAGKGLTEEQIGNEIAAITDELAHSLLPTIDDFAKSGETAVQALARISLEFTTLQASIVDLGAGTVFARQLLDRLTIGGRSALVELAGGVDNLQKLTSYFSENYLSPAEQIGPLIEGLTNAATDLGFAYSTQTSKAQVKDLIQSGQISEETRISLLKLLPTFDRVKDTLEAMAASTDTVATSVEDFAAVVDGLKSGITATYNSERDAIESTVDKFGSLAVQFRGFRESLLLGSLSPLTPKGKLDEARAEFDRTRVAAEGGDQGAISRLTSVSQDFLSASQAYNASSDAYLQDFRRVQSVMADAESIAVTGADIAENQLVALDSSVSNLIDINKNTATLADQIRDLNVAVLGGQGNKSISTSDIQSFLSANQSLGAQDVANVATSKGVSLAQLSAAGYDTSKITALQKSSGISDAQIRDFVKSNANDPMAIYQAAMQNGISSSRLSGATGLAMTDIDKFIKDNGLQSLGGIGAGAGMQKKGASTSDELVKLRYEVARLRTDQSKQTGDMIKVTDITSKQNADAIAKALAETNSKKMWSEQQRAIVG